MIFLLDMNLSPKWLEIFKESGINAHHWSETGNHSAPDSEIFNYAKDNDYIIITCDLDFTALLALSGAEKPGVILIRSKNIMPSFFAEKLISAIKENAEAIEKGAILVIDDEKNRIRILPLT
jgi:predicted nuclease of predicted toxin-antitoxin system